MFAAAFGMAADAVTPSDSSRWGWLQIASRLTSLVGISGTSPTDMFVVGSRGTLLHFDGVRWTSQSSGTPRNLTAVWALSPSDVFAVGFDGTILHFDGKEWERQTSGTTRTLSAIWAESPSNVVAVGRSGTILRYDGRAWRSQRSGSGQDLLAVWGSSASDVYAGGTWGTLFHYDGRSWSRVEVPSPKYHRFSQFNAIGGTSSSDVYAGGWEGFSDADVDRTGALLHYDGRSWTSVPGSESELVSSLWAVSPRDILMTGRTLNGLNDVRRYDGERLSTVTSDVRYVVQKIWAAPGGGVFAVGEGGRLLREVPGPR